MIILDTNVLYCAAGIENSEGVNVELLIDYIKENKCVCTKYSVFEILNSNFSFDEKMKVLKFIKENNIVLGSSETINKVVYEKLDYRVKDEKYYIKLKKIYGDNIIDEMTNNIAFFIICYAYTSITVIIDNYQSDVDEKKEYFRKCFVRYQKDVDLYIRKKINKEFKKLLSVDSFNVDTIEELFLKLVSNLMTYYYELMKKAKILFEGNDVNAYYKLTNIFRKLKNQIIKDDLLDNVDYDIKYLSICKIVIDYFKTNKASIRLKIGSVKKYLSNKIMNSIYFVDPSMRNEFEFVWTTILVNSLMVESAKVKPNDFIDYEILRTLYYDTKYTILISFDTKVQKILKGVSSCDKFQNSIEVLKSLKK